MRHSDRIQKLMGRMRKPPPDQTANPNPYVKRPSYPNHTLPSDSKFSPTNQSRSKGPKPRLRPPMDDLVFSALEDRSGPLSADIKYTRTLNSFTRDRSRSRSQIRDFSGNNFRTQKGPESLLGKRRELTGGSEILDDSRSMEYILDNKASKSALSYDEPSEKTLKLEQREFKHPICGVDLQSYEQAKPTPTSNSKPARPKPSIPHFHEPLVGLLRTLPKEGPNG
jgi:hypothetical protein